jgi:hypothetical protein
VHLIASKKTHHAKRNIAQCDVLKYKQKREGRRWQDMANVCTFCPRGLSWAFPAKLNAPPHANATQGNRYLVRVCACTHFLEAGERPSAEASEKPEA